MTEPIIFYKSSFCPHSWRVERFLKANKIPITLINIDRDPQARQEVMALNRGFASVPTLIFPDGSQLTEPSLGEIGAKLNMEIPGFLARLTAYLSKL
jgi:mycoredoxin